MLIFMDADRICETKLLRACELRHSQVRTECNYVTMIFRISTENLIVFPGKSHMLALAKHECQKMRDSLFHNFLPLHRSIRRNIKPLPQPQPSLRPLGRFTLRRSIQIKNILLSRSVEIVGGGPLAGVLQYL